MFVIGSLKCFGLLYTEMLEHFSEGSGKTAWIGSIAWFLSQGLGLLITKYVTCNLLQQFVLMN